MNRQTSMSNTKIELLLTYKHKFHPSYIIIIRGHRYSEVLPVLFLNTYVETLH